MELIYQTDYRNREEAMTDIFYNEGLNSRQRRHST